MTAGADWESGRSWRITDKEREQIAEMLQAGQGAREIAAATKRSLPTIYNHMRDIRAGRLPTGAARITDKERKQIAEMLQAGQGAQEIAAATKRSLPAIYRHISDIKPGRLPTGAARITDKERKQIAEMLQAGQGAQEIAAATKRSLSTIYNHMRDIRRAGRLPTGAAWITDKERKQIAEMMQAGQGAREIAAATKRSLPTIYRHISDIKAGRSPEEARRRWRQRRDLEAGGSGCLPADQPVNVPLLIERYALGASIGSLASSLRISYHRVRALIVDAGVPIRRNGARGPGPERKGHLWTTAEASACRRMMAQGQRQAIIGMALGRSEASIGAWLYDQSRPGRPERAATISRRRRGDLLPEETPEVEVMDRIVAGWLDGESVVDLAVRHRLPSPIISGVLRQRGHHSKKGRNPAKLKKQAQQAALATCAKHLPAFGGNELVLASLQARASGRG